ncbi:TniB family NTP-binding protein, partial [Candidatus Woesearchaeota archaeon]|nr:TniB family NTP-binding protein [Candidatus Woesearchaeota archaeon]
MEKKDLVAKICLFGEAAVGKTSLIRRFVLDQYDDRYLATIGAKVSKKVVTVQVPEKNIEAELTVMIWDIMGQK